MMNTGDTKIRFLLVHHLQSIIFHTINVLIFKQSFIILKMVNLSQQTTEQTMKGLGLWQ